ncbi:MAG: hypothetical protein ABIP69_03575 [Ferruginibacter sp.]
MVYNFNIPNRRKKFAWVDWGMAIAGLLLLILGKTIPAFLLFVMSALGFVMRRDVSFTFTEDEVVINTTPKKSFHWNEFNQILLKDGILTMDFKNNKLIQEELLDHNNHFSENEFNDFCLNKIK